jgi:hypothetical protein
MSCAMAMDVAAGREDQVDGARSAAVLRMCALLCDATASSIARMRAPEVDAISDTLVACGVACRAARADCRRTSLGGSGAETAAACRACATICERLVARAELAWAA